MTPTHLERVFSGQPLDGGAPGGDAAEGAIGGELLLQTLGVGKQEVEQERESVFGNGSLVGLGRGFGVPPRRPERERGQGR